jgi:hypothetical protein
MNYFRNQDKREVGESFVDYPLLGKSYEAVTPLGERLFLRASEVLDILNEIGEFPPSRLALQKGFRLSNGLTIKENI